MLPSATAVFYCSFRSKFAIIFSTKSIWSVIVKLSKYCKVAWEFKKSICSYQSLIINWYIMIKSLYSIYRWNLLHILMKISWCFWLIKYSNGRVKYRLSLWWCFMNFLCRYEVELNVFSKACESVKIVLAKSGWFYEAFDCIVASFWPGICKVAFFRLLEASRVLCFAASNAYDQSDGPFS